MATVSAGATFSPHIWIGDDEPGFKIRCECGAEWCEHLEDLIRSGQDAPLLWEALGQADRSPGTLSVPLMPSRSMWIVVQYESSGPDTVQIRATEYRATTDPQVIGLMVRGEGLDVARTIIHDAALSWLGVMPGAPTCRSGRHGMRSHLLLSEALKDSSSARYLENAATFWSSGMCKACWTDSAGLDVGIPDF